ncbi:glycosyltransferase [Methylobacterium sp. CM6244]
MTLTLPQATFAPDADRPLVTIVIPTFNERDNIAVICGRIAASLDRHPFEVIVVDDDSPDGTSAVVESLAKADSRIRIITRTGRRGLAGACIEGMLAARSELVAVMDADLQHEPATLVPMLDLMASTKCDIVIASRYVDDPDVAAFSSVRQALSNAGNRLVRALLRVQTSDPMSGFFLMRRSILVKAEPRLSRDGFKLLADILVQGGRAMKIKEVPYVFGPRLTGQSKLDERVLFDFAVLLIAKSVFGALPTRFVSFALVGGLGVIVHLALLGLMLYVLNDNFLLSQTAATLGAMTANFFLNNVLTYRDQRIVGIDLLRGLAVFCLSCSCGAFNNILVAHLIYTATGIWWLATGVGILVGAACNYVLSALTVWRRFDKRQDREKQAPEGDAVLSKGGGDVGIAQPPYVSR